MREAAQRLGYANNSMIYYCARRLGLGTPRRWRLKPWVGIKRSERVPKVILQTEGDRSWVAALRQGEGAAIAQYSKKSGDTSFVLSVAMTDPAPVFKFCDLCGRGRPKKPAPRLYPWKPIWTARIGGLRAYRVLQEILPHLVGQKLDEAKRALELFAPYGYRKGRHTAYEIWHENEFPLRKLGPSKYAQSLRAKDAVSSKGRSPPDDSNRISMHFDRTCLRIADVLIDANPRAIGLVEIMDGSGASWTAVIHHLKHLEENLLVTKERIYQKRGPNVLYKALPRLAELRHSGWIPDSPSSPSNEVLEPR